MRILMLTCHPGIQGPFPKILPLLASALCSQGCVVETEPWARRHDSETFFEKVLRVPGDLFRIYRRLRREKFDVLVVHTTTEWPNYGRDIPVLRLCRHLVSRVVLQFHGSAPGLVLGPGNSPFKKASRTLLNLSDAVLVLSSEEQRQWQKFHPSGRFFVVTNPFQSFVPRDLKGELPWNLPKNVPLLLYTGRLMTPKGVFDLLEALAQLRNKMRFHLLVAGTGPEEQAFKERIATLGLQPHITLAGYLSSDQLRLAYGAADLFVFPSWSEGFPTVITEAMDAGLPIVTTRIRGADDHLKEGIHVCFVPPRNPGKLAETIARVLGDSSLRSRMSKANRLKVKEFSPEVVGAHYFHILKQVASGTTVTTSAADEQNTEAVEILGKP